MEIFNIILSILFALTCLAAMFIRQKHISNNFICRIDTLTASLINNHYVLILAAILIIGAFVRIYRFGTIPYGFNQDEAMAALEGLSLSKYGTDHYGMRLPVYFTAWGHSQMNVLLSYIMIPFFKIFGASVFTARLPLLIFSMISLWIIYRFSYKVLGKNAALAVLFIAAINPWQIMMSRWALEANLFPHLLLYGSYMLFLGIEKKRYIYLSMIVFALAMYSYGISYYTVPLLLLMICIYFICTKVINIKHAVLSLIIYLSLSWPIFLMMAVNKFELDTISLPFMTIPFFEQGERMGDILFFSNDIFIQFFINLWYTVKTAILQLADLSWNSISEYGPLYLCSLPLLVLGIILFITSMKKQNGAHGNKGIFIILAMFITAFISGLITNYVNINRINAIFYPMIIFIGYGVYYICKRFKITLIPFVLAFLILFTSFSAEYFTGDHADYLGHCFYYGFDDSLMYVKNMNYDKLYITAKSQDFNMEYTFSSEIITLFILEIDNKYYLEGNEYNEKYKYSLNQFTPDKENPQVLYIAHLSEKVYFSESLFDFKYFNEYCVVTHKSYSES